MKATIIKRAPLENLPSASGVEIIDGVIYIIGDDTPYMYVLDHSLKLLEKVTLFDSEDFETGRIPKKIKPDLECMTTLTIHGNKYILAMGSGSKENRDKGFLIKLPTRYNKKYIVQPFSFTRLYNLLRSNPDIAGNGRLNLEAAAADGQHFILFNRANKSGNNVLLYFQLEEFIVYLTENPDLVPFPVIQNFDLPSIEGVPAGFSGASFWEGKIFFTAAAEDTSDAVDDGEVHGSLLGCMDIHTADYLRGGIMKDFCEMKGCVPITEKDKIFKGKVESISLYEKDSETQFVALAITDDDKGGSELLMLEIDLA